jgi:LacI family transcriptional regulator
MSTIADIAREAGVSTAAVSFALNNKRGVSAELRGKILGIAARMGYSRIITEWYNINENIRIKFLKIAKHGHIVNEQHNAFITEYLEGIESEALKRKYKLEISFLNKIPIEQIVKSQRDVPADGFIILGTELETHELSYFSGLNKPVVFIDTYFPMTAYNCIDIDNFDGVFRVIQHLYDNGHRSIGLIKNNYKTRNSIMRELGFKEVMEYFSLPLEERYIFGVDPTLDGSYRDVSEYLKTAPGRQGLSGLPTAFFCINDIIAFGCIRALREQQYRVPEDISVAGFDDLPSGKISDPPLTTIRVSTRRIGQRALAKLAVQIAGIDDGPPENILIPGKLVPRGSVKKVTAPAARLAAGQVFQG